MSDAKPLGAQANILLDLYAGQFAARHDGFLIDSGVHVNERLTPEVLYSAFKHGHSISGYMAYVDDSDGVVRTHVGAIDFDEGTEAQVQAIEDVLIQHAIRPLRVGSRRGCHLWVFINGHMRGSDGTIFATMPATTVSRALNHAIRLVSPELHASGKAEVFPKSTHGHWPGGALRMPLMQHPKSGLVYPAYMSDGRPIDTLAELMEYVADLTTWHDDVHLFAGLAPAEYPRGLAEHATPRQEYDGPSVSALLASMGIEAQPGKATFCPFHDDKRKSLSVALDDERAWCKAPHCQAYNDGHGVGSIQMRAMLEAR